MCCDHVHRILYEVRKIGRPKSIRQSKNSGSRLLNGKQQGRNDNDVRLQGEYRTHREEILLLFVDTEKLTGPSSRAE